MPPDFNDGFNPDIYCDRGIIVQAILDWVDHPIKSCYCLIGSPGKGKSWILGYIAKYFSDEKEIPVIKTEHLKSYFVEYPGDSPKLEELALKKWVQDCYTTLKNRYGPAIPPYNDLKHPAASINALVSSLSNIPGDAGKLLLIVDGFDEVPMPLHFSQDILVENVVKRFLSNNYERKNVLILFSQRTNIDRYPLILSADRILKNIGEEADVNPWDQFQKVHAYDYRSLPDITENQFEQWQGCLSYYHWNNLFVNDHLYRSGLESAVLSLNSISKAILKNCIAALLVRPRQGIYSFPKLSTDDFDFLVEISQLAVSFPRDDLDPLIKRYSTTRKDNIYTHPLIKNLISVYGVLYPDPNNPSRLCLDECLRALLRDYFEM
jgi:hypothetical protein